MFKQIKNFIIIVVCSLTLALTWTPSTVGQIPIFTTPTDNQTTSTTPWDLNQAYACGRFWCSDVYIYDDSRRIQTTLLTPELTLAALKELNQSNIEVTQALEQRAKLVQQVFDKIFQNIITNQTNFEVPHIADWQFWLPTSVKELWYPATLKPSHPWTPNIEIGFKNQQTVIYITSQFDLGIASQSIVTVTDMDAKANGTTVEQLAKKWQDTIKISFSNALWGYEFDRQYPKSRWFISGVIIGITLILIWLIELIRNFLRKWNNNLIQKLRKLTEFLTIDAEATAHQKNDNNKSESLGNKQAEKNEFSNKSEKFPPKITRFLNFIKKIFRKNTWIYNQLSRSKQKIFLRRQTLLKQKINLSQLFIRIDFILELIVLILGITIITLIFRQTRFFSVYLLKESLNLLIIWIGLIFIDKLGDFVIDYYLNRWASEAQVTNPNSNRYTLRVNTYSITLKQATTFITIVLGIYISLWIIGLDLSILAGAGIFAVAIAFLSRNLLEDMLNGILILCTDRYAIGDVIDIGGGMSGLVEDINLFVTSLRNLDGQVIAIPNSKITTVINNTKDWSRVNFTIKIAWNEDVKKAINIMIKVANQMQKEPEWGKKFLEAIEVLGVDEISHEGILIHLLIKTQPSEHWGIGREFRLRVKQALDEAGISLGIPHHKISVSDSSTNNDKLLAYFLSKQDS
ncbi:mechanosensitive ion channel family protein [Crocosphaera sp. UHCC 0190]|uniref:mechanosensitive ion channel family protein n=1 Tax=Crocosphaera sp. UHCC 0190 TaxID=3110246 RepID=UPI002B1FCF8F|nr:mechanosensitive ion channel family protein [Crocosphaera sp. UHCC 0190]MEA5512174.1 mechanosensitive ion channel family protein [Crocosphaera sp. UHCC 0190]